jgi:hypothetical protein
MAVFDIPPLASLVIWQINHPVLWFVLVLVAVIMCGT